MPEVLHSSVEPQVAVVQEKRRQQSRVCEHRTDDDSHPRYGLQLPADQQRPFYDKGPRRDEDPAS